MTMAARCTWRSSTASSGFIRDGTEYGIAQELLDAGIPMSRIVLAFRSLERRRRTDFAVS